LDVSLIITSPSSNRKDGGEVRADFRSTLKTFQYKFAAPLQRLFTDTFDSEKITIGDEANHVGAMSSHILPATSGLVGIALIVRSKDGPRFVFHYPPRLTPNESQEKPLYGTELDPTTPDPSDGEDSSEDDDLDDDVSNLHRSLGGLGLERRRTRHVSPWDGFDHFENEDGTHIVPWEHLDAFSTQDLASILTPARPYHKKCFELTLDPLHFVTYPMFVRQDGYWKKTKKQKKKKKRRHSDNGEDVEEPNGDEARNGSKSTATEDESDYDNGMERKPEANGRHANNSATASENGVDDGGMTMFNLVFILNPSRLEAAARVQAIFEYVAKDINKALRYAQHYNNYVSKESDLILTMKDKAREDSQYCPRPSRLQEC